MKLFIALSAVLAMGLVADAIDPQALTMINQVRVNHGQTGLCPSTELDKFAMHYSNLMARNNKMEGGLPDPHPLNDVSGDWKLFKSAAVGADEIASIKQLLLSGSFYGLILGDYNFYGAGVAYNGSTPYFTGYIGKNNNVNATYPGCLRSDDVAPTLTPTTGSPPEPIVTLAPDTSVPPQRR